VLSDLVCIKSGGKVNVVLSPQDLISCDSTDMGCDGGYLPNAWDYLEEFGIVTDECMPYVSGDS
jgi:cathepsin B